MTESLFLDVRYALRSLARTPGFAGVAILTLALSIGATTAVFSVIDGVLLKPLPVQEQGRLLVVWKAVPERGTEHWPFSYASYEGMRERLRTVSGLAAHPYAGALTATLHADTESVLLRVTPVTGDWFEVLGVQPRIGRLLTADDDRVGAAPVIVASSGLAEHLFGSAAGALGRTLRLNESAYTIVGIAPAEFEFPRGSEAWAPAAPFVLEMESVASLQDAFRVAWDLVARVAPGFTIDQTRADLASALRSLATESSDSDLGRQIIRAPLFADVVVGDVRPSLLMLAGAVLLMFLAAGLSVANLLLVRGLARRRELVVRTAIGASRGRILRQLATEAFVLAAIGALLAVFVAHVILQALLALAPAELPRLTHIGVDGRALVFTVGAAMVAAILFGMLPALQTVRVEMGAALRAPDGSAEPGSRRYWLRHSLVVTQVAIAALVLSTAWLLLRSFDRIQRLDVGFAAEDLLLVDIALSPSRFAQVPDQQNALARLAERVATLPGVNRAATLATHPFAGSAGADIMVVAEGQSLDQTANPFVNYEGADPAYFATLGLPSLRGRAIENRDRPDSEPVVMVNEAFARLFWSGDNPVGRRVRWSWESEWRTVIGLVADTRYREWTNVRPSIYVPYGQGIPVSPRYLAVRTGNPAAVAGSIRRAVTEEPGATVVGITPLPRLLAAPLARPRFQSALVTSFAALGLVLSVIGVYSVLAFFVRQRRREIGIRITLGANPAQVRRVVLRQGLIIGMFGVLIGIASAAAAGRFVQPLLFGVSATDPLVFSGTAIALLMATVAASLLPVRLATRTDPLIVMRSD